MLPGICFVGNNGYMKNSYTATPYKKLSDDPEEETFQDAYNFYQLQVQITIKRAFVILVHCWAIIPAPLTITAEKVLVLMMCLCRLHNFCQDRLDINLAQNPERDVRHLYRVVCYNNFLNKNNNNFQGDNGVVTLTESGRPSGLLDEGNHFRDVPQN